MLGVRLNWDKRYITLAPIATVLGLAFKLYDPDHLLSGQSKRGITLALIPTDLPGVSIGSRHDPLGVPFLNGPTRGHDVFIPLTAIIGGEAGIGQGWRMLMACLSEGRGISLPALSTGAAKYAARISGAYGRVRQQFGLPIGRFEGVGERLGRLALEAYRMESARRVTLQALDSGLRPAVISGIVKQQLTEGMRRSVNDAMDVWGGTAICQGPSNLLANAYRAIPIGITVEGANILTRSLMIFGQGAVRAHPWLLQEIQAATGDGPYAERLIAFDRALFGHIVHVKLNALRSLFHGLTGGWLASAPRGTDGALRRLYQRLAHASSNFAIASDLALARLAGGLKRREALSGRLADVLSHLYLASALLKRFEDDGRPDADLLLLQTSVDDSLHQVERALIGVIENFPDRIVGGLMGLLIFPWGSRNRAVDDARLLALAERLDGHMDDMQRLLGGLYIPWDEREPLAQLENARMLARRAAEPEKRFMRWLKTAQPPVQEHAIQAPEGHLQEAVDAGVITPLEAQRLQQLAQARLTVTAVDEFPSVCWINSSKERAA
ncbi:putative acyl-CoA dehydrogenase [Magnetofaba australis IT-1]|uniref:Acyl-coenzyme A dehydrogenase n=1 Tax=Magnetofaba australis IT-1 TaxID=1434232 RepID=A0A1Y2K0J3_9PROT|nr:putative acyl-CoA dehydrogenase [Magnetofaba australis IT-1]